jgi:phytoene synthase
MRILPRAQREAMYAIYGFCRAVDDIADGEGPREQRRAEIAQWRGDVRALYAGTISDNTRDLAPHVSRFDLAQDDFLGVIAGMEMDVVEDIRAPSLETLDIYCDRVASAVGRLSVRVFGVEAEPGRMLAHHLGRALQITNILRDLDEDSAVGRLYLPREALRQAGIETSDPAAALASQRLGDACLVMAARAQEHFDKADDVMARCRRRAVRSPRIMAEVYRAMLARLVERGWSPPRQRVRIPKARLVWILLRHALV